MSMNVDFTDKSDGELNRLIEDYREEGEGALFKVCQVLYELHVRGLKHVLFKDNIYRHFDLIRNRKITPAIVIYFNGNKKFVERMKDYKDTQKRVSSDNPFTVAVMRQGEIASAELPVGRMNWATFDRLFPGEGKIRKYSEQWTLLNEELEEKKRAEEAAIEAKKNEPIVPRIKAVNGKIVIGDETFTLSELNDTLQSLGFSIVSNS